MSKPVASDPLTPQEVVAVIELLVSAMEMLSSGIAALQDKKREPDTDSVLQPLAVGFERFLKLTLIEVTRNAKGARPEREKVKALSHSLLEVLDALIEVAGDAQAYAERPACRADLEFLRADGGLRQLLDVLGHFGAGGRYSQLDGLLKGTFDPEAEPRTRWGEIEAELLIARSDFDSLEAIEMVQASSEEIVSRLQRMARAIARMWTLGAVGDEGGQFCGVLGTFLFLRDEQLAIAATR